MSSTALGHADPFRPPAAPGVARGFGFAIVAHALLVLALSAGISWHAQPEPAFEAELWSVVPQAAAPRAAEPEPEPEPKPEPVAKTAPPPEEAQQQQRDAEITIARDKKRREDEAKRQAELEAERKKRELQAKQEQQDKLEKERTKERERQKELDKKKAEDKQRQQQEARDKAREDAKREQLRQDNLKRMMGLAGATGSSNSTGTALQSSGPSATYAGRIKARIRPNIIFTDSGNGNPVAEVEVRVAPDGNIIARKLLKASGDADWDKAVLRAIDKTETLPRDTDGRVPPVIVISFKPGE
ncbi:cell envelope integrity protein TolA [Paucibacter sp. APW11]|uniref:Cell envelope integrity protein TolA n=1 Tax=Roseateles aquae TaxID=3077235 RepID=A0ABU3P842_9BURK|nr:cell envelope integrity protein TolA [Paucibacter sp. APW11]MDT8998734.1 cell envelope integrity protein TolA [Paucibacter sp. APW11]